MAHGNKKYYTLDGQSLTLKQAEKLARESGVTVELYVSETVMVGDLPTYVVKPDGYVYAGSRIAGVWACGY